MKKKKREFLTSDLVKQFAKTYGWEEKLEIFKIRDFLKSYLTPSLNEEIINIDLTQKVLTLKISSPLLQNDFRMRSQTYLQKFRDVIGEEKIEKLKII